ncbi:hypothetical protein EON63_13165 [archaeon]|nr:MAG: hypothetical protein EON63_13165 [archaeon]
MILGTYVSCMIMFSSLCTIRYTPYTSRTLEHSTILYETQDLSPLMKLAWNKLDPNYIATIPCDGSKTYILDIRYGSVVACILSNEPTSYTTHHTPF